MTDLLIYKLTDIRNIAEAARQMLSGVGTAATASVMHHSHHQAALQQRSTAHCSLLLSLARQPHCCCHRASINDCGTRLRFLLESVPLLHPAEAPRKKISLQENQLAWQILCQLAHFQTLRKQHIGPWALQPSSGLLLIVQTGSGQSGRQGMPLHAAMLDRWAHKGAWQCQVMHCSSGCDWVSTRAHHDDKL